MNKLALIIFIVTSAIGLRAQFTYIPMPSNMVLFGRTEESNSSSSSGTTSISYRSEITGDTIIGAYTYKKLYSGLGPFNVTKAIRNDTLNKKVYIYSVSTGAEKLLYDFNLGVGDTVNQFTGYGFYEQMVAAPFGSPTIIKAWVTSIDSVLMLHDGLFHRRFNFNGTVDNGAFADVVVSSSSFGPYSYGSSGGPNFELGMQPLIEGVGQISNPINHSAFAGVLWDYVLFCAYINNVSLLPGSPTPDLPLCYSIYTGMDEIKESQEFILYPNPTNGLLQIKTGQEINSIEVVDVFGRRMLYSEKNQTEINISDFMNGIYFVRLSDSKENYLVKKVVKQ